MTKPKSIFYHPLFGATTALLIVILGFLFQFYYQRKIAREDTQNSDIFSLKYENINLKTQHRLDSAAISDIKERIRKLEFKTRKL
jgi:hypothetical protein